MIASFFVLQEKPKYAINRIKKVSDSVSIFAEWYTHLKLFKLLIYRKLNYLAT